jgi:hypothetical protein
MGNMVTTAASLAIALSLCGSAFAQSPVKTHPPASNPLDTVANGLKFRADPPPPAGFVGGSRKPDAELQYVPIVGARPEPERRVLSSDEIRAREAELDAVRTRHDGMARRKSPVGPFKSAARETPKPVKPPEQGCLITCVVTSTVVKSVGAVAPPAASP